MDKISRVTAASIANDGSSVPANNEDGCRHSNSMELLSEQQSASLSLPKSSPRSKPKLIFLDDEAQDAEIEAGGEFGRSSIETQIVRQAESLPFQGDHDTALPLEREYQGAPPDIMIPYEVEDPIERQALEVIYQQGLRHLKRHHPNYAGAVKRLRVAAERGHTAAMIELGHLYRNGLCILQDFDHARIWYYRAAERGNPQGYIYLGLLYEKGIGVMRNICEAIKHYRLAADQGEATAQYILGFLHEKGIGVDRDYDSAAYWYNLAIAQGHDGAQLNLRNLICILPKRFV